MKNLILLLCLSISFVVSAQITDFQLDELTPEINATEETQENILLNTNDDYVLDSTYRYYYDEELSYYDTINRNLYTYNEYGLETEECIQSWYSDLQNWSECSYFLSSYDNNGQLIEYTFKYWHPFDLAWVYEYRSLFTYSDEKLIELRDQEWDQENEQWLDDSRLTYQYDEYDNVVLVSFQRWNYEIPEDWSNIWKYALESLNDQYLPEEKIFYRWDSFTMSWNPERRNLFFYDDAKNITEQQIFEWNITTNSWVTEYRYVDIYNLDGYLVKSLRQNWNGLDWYDYWRHTYLYDDNFNQTAEIAEFLTINGLQLIWKEELTYDENDNKIQKQGYAWDANTENWIPGEREDYFWSRIITSVNTLWTNNIDCKYANPYKSGDIIHCSFNFIEDHFVTLFNLIGQPVYQNRFSNYDETVIAKEMSPGNYILVIRNQNGQILYRNKLVVIQ